MRFEIINDKFVKDGKEIKLISGAVHYFRHMPEAWDGIFKKAKALGLNCIETYVAWNMHEPEPDVFCFDGRFNIAEFIKNAQDNDLMVIVRPGPYICAEWEFGGLPWWLQNYDSMEIRCMNEEYIKRFDIYLDRLFDEIRPMLCTNGGPVIMLQCENEYGYYGDDKEYLNYLKAGYRRRGIDVPLFTSDGIDKGTLLDGTIEGCLATLNFGGEVGEKFKSHTELFPNQPKMCMEMWNGWFDAWGDKEHHTTSAESYAKTVSDMLKIGHLNMYMFIGGTNFGFTSGANHFEKYAPDVTSYDYDAPLSECGDITPKYLMLRDVIKQYTKEPLPDIPENRPKKAYGKVLLTQNTGLFENLGNLSAPIFSNVPKCMENYGIGYGYILYQTTLNRDYNDAKLSFSEIGDRAQIYVGDSLQGIVYVNDDELTLKISAKTGDTLSILVENMGRTNFGAKMMRKKGLSGRVLLDGKIHFSWNVYPLSMDNLDKLDFDKEAKTDARFYKGSFNIDDELSDTFLKLDNFTKGFVIINGFNLGRYWKIGPQKTLYVPASLLKTGENIVVVFESDAINGTPEIEFIDKPDIGNNI